MKRISGIILLIAIVTCHGCSQSTNSKINDAPLLTTAERNKQQNSGGSGIVHLTFNKGMLSGIRNITLWLNIPGYTASSRFQGMQSGLAMGASCPAILQCMLKNL